MGSNSTKPGSCTVIHEPDMLQTLLKLGRVSNLPTVWSNTLAGAVLAGTSMQGALSIPLLLAISLLFAMSLAYIGGMFLNDAYDADIDAAERPERPIPAGKIKKSAVFIIGYGMLFISVALVAFTASRSQGIVLYAAVAALVLCICVVLYNVWHKGNPLSPLIMGLCRMLVYISAAYALLPEPSGIVFAGATVTLCYLIGLTYVAKYENKTGGFALWPVAFFVVPIGFGLFQSMNSVPTMLFTLLFGCWLLYSLRFILDSAKRHIPKAVVSMIAGISLLDAIYISSTGATGLAIFAVATFALTLYLQRYVAGT